MRVGLDFRPAMVARTGIGRYAAGLASALAGSCDLRLFGVFRRGNRPPARRAPDGARLVAWPVPSRLFHLLPASWAVGRCDLFHHTNFLMVRVAAKTPQVMTVHDLAFLRDPSSHTPRARRALTAVVRRAAGRCAALIAPSEATARDCERFLDVDRSRIFVTPLGVEHAWFDTAPAPSDRPYLLAVGTLEPRKNHARLIRAFARVDADVELRIAGAPGWLCGEVLELARTTPRVTLLGHRGEVELRALYAGAAAILYPSLLEGFGLPVLEGMAAGRPVVTSDRDPLRRIARDAAVLVDPEDEESIAAGIERALHDDALRERLARAGPERARQFTWEECANRTLAAYEAVLA